MAEESKVENETVTYVSPDAPCFTIVLVILVDDKEKDHRITFKNKELHLDAVDDKPVIDALDYLLGLRPDLSAQIKKTDKAEAAKIAHAHMQLSLRRQQASKGTADSTLVSQALDAEFARREAELLSKGATPEEMLAMRKEMANAGLDLTVDSEGEVVRDKEGFVPDPEKPALETVPDGEKTEQPKSSAKSFKNILTRKPSGE